MILKQNKNTVMGSFFFVDGNKKTTGDYLKVLSSNIYSISKFVMIFRDYFYTSSFEEF